MKRFAVVVACVSVVALLAGCSPKVPDVSGMTLATATRTLADAGYVTGAPTYDAASTSVSGTVVAQDPDAGSSLTDGSTVLLKLAGPAPIPAPVLSGVEATAAAAAVQQLGLKYEVTEAYSDTVPKGQVISQTPAAGVTAPPGSTVRVVVSKGGQPVKVPNVVGKTATEASAALVAAGLRVETKVIVSQTASGTVVSQSPKKGKTVARGAAVTISVSGDTSRTSQLRGTWRAKDGTTYEFRMGNRVATPSGGATRYRLTGETLMIYHSANLVVATLKWVSADRITISILGADKKPGPVVTYDRVK